MNLNRQFDHVYAIIRIDHFQGDIPLERKVTVKKIVWDAEEAEREVDRLNRLQTEPGVSYFTQMTRLERSSAMTTATQIVTAAAPE